MSSTIQPIKVWGKRGANPPKVITLCEELGIPYEAVDLDFAQLKQKEFLSINPNGRMPAIQDPNTRRYFEHDKDIARCATNLPQ